MLKVLHSDKAKAVLLHTDVSDTLEKVEDSSLADEFNRLLDDARGKLSADRSSTGGPDALSLAIMVAQQQQTLGHMSQKPPPEAKEKEPPEGAEVEEESADSVEQSPSDGPLRGSFVAVEQRVGPSGLPERRSLPDAGDEESQLQDDEASLQDDSESLGLCDEGVEGNSEDVETATESMQLELEGAQATENTTEKPLELKSDQSEEDTLNTDAPADAMEGELVAKPEESPSASEPNVSVVKTTSNQLEQNSQVNVRAGTAEVAIAAEVAVLTEEGEKTADLAESAARTEGATAAKQPAQVNASKPEGVTSSAWRPEVRDIEILRFIEDSAGSLLKRNSQAVAQMMLLKQAFEQGRAHGNGNEAVSALSRASAGANGANSGAFGSLVRGQGGEPPVVREKAQPSMPRAATYKMLERVQATLKEAARARDGKTLSVQLDPIGLGRIKVDVSLRDGALHARLTPENTQVLHALREHAHDLQGALRKLGLDVERITVNVSAESQDDLSSTSDGLGDGKGFQGNRNNMPGDQRQVPENTFGNELAEGIEVAREAVKPAQVSWRDNWVA